MGAKYNALNSEHIEFISKQHLFFVATADEGETRVNLSPKGGDCLRIVDENMVVWLSKVGNGNETAAHIQHNPRMTLMFCSFDEKPLIVRLYGRAIEIRPDNEKFTELLQLFDDTLGVRQFFAMHIELVHNSCGFGVPFFEFKGNRPTMNDWAEKKGAKGLREYVESRNVKSIDNKDIII